MRHKRVFLGRVFPWSQLDPGLLVLYCVQTFTVQTIDSQSVRAEGPVETQGGLHSWAPARPGEMWKACGRRVAVSRPIQPPKNNTQRTMCSMSEASMPLRMF